MRRASISPTDCGRACYAILFPGAAPDGQGVRVIGFVRAQFYARGAEVVDVQSNAVASSDINRLRCGGLSDHPTVREFIHSYPSGIHSGC